jgi:hypothetical protein
MSEGPVIYKDDSGEETLFGSEETGAVTSGDGRVEVKHILDDDTVKVTQFGLGNRDVVTTLHPGESLPIGGSREISHEEDLI